MDTEQAQSVGGALDRARQVMAERFGHDLFLPGQEESLGSILSRRNLLVVMPTGSGKSLLYQLPALLDDGLTLVVSPLIALMKDQVDDLAGRGIPATFVNSSLSVTEQRARLSRCSAGEYKLLYIAPERFRNSSFLAAIKKIKVARMAVDEAHCISEWGHDFRPDYLRLKKFRELMGRPLVTALTATATVRVQHDIIEALGITSEDVDVHVHGFDRPNLALQVIDAFNDNDKNNYLLDFIGRHDGAGIVYTGTRKTTEKVGEFLRLAGIRAAVYHAGMEPDEREAAQDRFIGGKDRVVAATSAFGMGIDKPDVRFVLHYNYPGSVEQYYQEIGRAGRDGQDSFCALLYSPADRFLREFFIDLNYPGPEIVESVYQTLWRIPENPVKLTYGQIADRCGEKIKDGQVGAAVRLLDQAGMTKAFSGEPRVALTFAKPGAELLNEVRGPAQRRVLEALSSVADIEVPGRFEAGLDELCRDAGLSEDQARRALLSLDHAGLIAYEAPFRGRGIEKLVNDPPPFDEVPIDWERHELLRGAEEDKLAAMEEYIGSTHCRREFILRYFGEKQSFSCGRCDRCQAKGGHAAEGKVMEREPGIALAALVCVRHMRFSVGRGKIVQVLTGSRDKKLLSWGLDRNPAYGLVSEDKAAVEEVMDELLHEGFIKREGDAKRPTLALTERGREAAMGADLESIRRPVLLPAAPEAAHAGPHPGVTAKYQAAAEDEIRAAVLRCVADMPYSVGVGKVCEVLTGSKAKWIMAAGVDQLEVYGGANAGRERIREVIAALLGEGLLKKGGDERYPTLFLTGQGGSRLSMAPAAGRPPVSGATPDEPPRHIIDEETAGPVEHELSEEEYREWAGQLYREEQVWPEAGTADVPARPAPDAAERLADLLASLLTAAPDEAKAMLPELGMYHPRQIMDRLVSSFDAAPDARLSARAVWAAGELGGRHALPFLIRCSSSDSDNVRRLAAGALGKAAAAARAEPAQISAELEKAREALTKLRNDPSIQVRQYAEKSLKEF